MKLLLSFLVLGLSASTMVTADSLRGIVPEQALEPQRNLEEAGLSAGQGTSNLVITRHAGATAGSFYYQFSLETHVAAICGAAGTTTTWKGEICDAASGKIQWTSVETAVGAAAPTAACTFTRAAKAGDTAFLSSYLGGCGVAPTGITIPMNVKTRKFEITSAHSNLCPGTTRSTIAWYGVPCASDANLIEWQYYHVHTAGTGHNCNSDPSQRVVSRSSAGSTEINNWLGSCGTEAIHLGLPIHSNFITYQQDNHQISFICASNPTSTVWVGESCPTTAGIKWNRMMTPDPQGCAANTIAKWDRSDAGWSAGVPAYLGDCNTDPTYSAIGFLPTTLSTTATVTTDKSAYTCTENIQFTLTGHTFYNPTATDEFYFTHTDGTGTATDTWANFEYDGYQIQSITREIAANVLKKDGTWTVGYRRAGTDVIASTTFTITGC